MASSSKQSWQLGDAGILRKKEEEEDELLVFGYSCKLFRDNEKALFIDQGKHLIPWMGDETLKIDRYDGRGTLYDLKQYEAVPGGYDENLWVSLSDSERHVEQLCNEERYRALHHNDEEEAIYQEEELKRLHQALGAKSYGEVAFNYNQNNIVQRETGHDGNGETTTPEEEDDEEFVAPPELDIPVNMVVPDRVKLNAIIEKTAMFISSQGAQMEILLKMKQANNRQFDFLSYDSPLHPYYRHLQMAIKTGRYHPKQEKVDTEVTEEEDEDGDYLHPSLVPSTSRVELAPSIPSIAYKPSADCAYSMLVNRIKDKQAAFSIQPPGTLDTVLPVQSVNKATSLVIEATPVLYNAPPPKTVSLTSVVDSVKKIFTPVIQAQHQIFPLESHNGATYPVVSPSFLTPPPDVQLIIDKMASYVAKNGRDFESIVRSKGDPRFEFLQVQHQYYPYYLHKVDVFEQLENPVVVLPVVPKPTVQSEPSSDSSANEDSRDSYPTDSNNTKPALTPVCFSIKKPKESDPVLDLKSALPVEESSGEEGEEKQEEQDEGGETELIDLTEEKTPFPALEESNVEKEKEVEKKINGKDRWEERVKDKLAAAAREKMAATSREKQLQLERKRRAAAFLTMIHQPKVPHSREDTPDQGSADEDEVSSVPSPMSTNSWTGLPETDPRPTSLLARIQGSKVMEKRPKSSSSDTDYHSPSRDRKKSKKSKTSHKSHRHRSKSPRSDIRSKSKKSKRHESSKSTSKHSSQSRHRDLSSSRSYESQSRKKKSRHKSSKRKSTSSDSSV